MILVPTVRERIRSLIDLVKPCRIWRNLWRWCPLYAPDLSSPEKITKLLFIIFRMANPNPQNSGEFTLISPETKHSKIMFPLFLKLDLSKQGRLLQKREQKVFINSCMLFLSGASAWIIVWTFWDFGHCFDLLFILSQTLKQSHY